LEFRLQAEILHELSVPAWRRNSEPGSLTRGGTNFITMKTLQVTSTIEHKHEGLPRFVCIPMAKVNPWKLQGTTIVEVKVNGVDIGRRSLKRWDDRNCWWMDLSNETCGNAKVETGDRVSLSLRIASEELPDELDQLLKNNAAARERWEQLTPAQKRMLREEVLAAKQSATRSRRAARGLDIS
jgi:hypothetical protein